MPSSVEQRTKRSWFGVSRCQVMVSIVFIVVVNRRSLRDKYSALMRNFQAKYRIISANKMALARCAKTLMLEWQSYYPILFLPSHRQCSVEKSCCSFDRCDVKNLLPPPDTRSTAFRAIPRPFNDPMLRPGPVARLAGYRLNLLQANFAMHHTHRNPRQNQPRRLAYVACLHFGK